MQEDMSYNWDAHLYLYLNSLNIDCIIVNMPANKAPGIDKMSINVQKDCYPYISQTLAGLINSSFHQDVFPVAWKKAEVMSHLKDGDHEIAGNNRPIYHNIRYYRKYMNVSHLNSFLAI